MPANRLRLALDEHISRACMEGPETQATVVGQVFFL